MNHARIRARGYEYDRLHPRVVRHDREVSPPPDVVARMRTHDETGLLADSLEERLFPPPDRGFSGLGAWLPADDHFFGVDRTPAVLGIPEDPPNGYVYDRGNGWVWTHDACNCVWRVKCANRCAAGGAWVAADARKWRGFYGAINDMEFRVLFRLNEPCSGVEERMGVLEAQLSLYTRYGCTTV